MSVAFPPVVIVAIEGMIALGILEGVAALWFRTAMNRYVSTGSIACSLTPLTHLLALHCPLRLHASLCSFIRSLAHSLPSSWEREWLGVSKRPGFVPHGAGVGTAVFRRPRRRSIAAPKDRESILRLRLARSSHRASLPHERVETCLVADVGGSKETSVFVFWVFVYVYFRAESRLREYESYHLTFELFFHFWATSLSFCSHQPRPSIFCPLLNLLLPPSLPPSSSSFLSFSHHPISYAWWS